MAPTASCHCGSLSISLPSQLPDPILCFCDGCRKISGSQNSYNFIFPRSDYKVLKDNTSKTFTSKGGSGAPMTSYFCSDCGSTVYRLSENPDLKELVIVKGGLVDGDDRLKKPSTQLFSDRKAGWQKDVDGVQTQDAPK